ncbi:sulfatase [Ruania rhizosphaerae]|uniref:sulfatase family protein n=1 Tax=Ruania rhizosphaerae TaxID=1840413 RepID=UPI0013581E9A|nr:sulfatase-like hydrolase/transferase [Ruania rhizosphaerae]
MPDPSPDPHPQESGTSILLITADQFRFDAIAAHGNPHIDTPNLDRLVASGMTFQRGYTESPVCVPARAGLLTGRRPHRSGVFDNSTPLEEGTPTITRELADAGLHTQAIGKMHFRTRETTHGFEDLALSEEVPHDTTTDAFLKHLHDAGVTHVAEPHGVRHELYYSPQPSQLPVELHTTTWTGERTAAYLEERAADGRQFFCWTSFIKPHPPFDPPYPYYLKYDPLTMPDPVRSESERERLGYHGRHQHRVKWTSPDLGLDTIRTIRAYYYALVSHVDAEIGRILDTLEETGLRERTLVVFTADHGEYLGDHWCYGKRGFHDSAARIPFVLSQPGTIPEGGRSDALVGLIDLAPTFLAATGTAATTLDPDGASVLPVATGAQDAIRDTWFGQYHHGPEGLYCAMNSRYKYIYSAADGREALLQVGSDETVDLLSPDHAADLAGVDVRLEADLLRKAIMEQFRADSYTEPLTTDGGWRVHPPMSMPALPGNGDRDPTGRGRQYPHWLGHVPHPRTATGGSDVEPLF